MERESNQELVFLDICIGQQDDGKLMTKLYRKATYTQRYLAYESHHLVRQKRAIVKSLTDQAENISSSKKNNQKEMQHSASTLQANGYPKRFILKASK